MANTQRKIIRSRPTAVDLFCGCGGLSCGLQRAGFTILAGVDNEPVSLQTFRRNFPQSQAFALDLSQVSPQELLAAIGIDSGELDLLAGGPPCQGFSKNVPRRNRYLEDPNNQLVGAFLRFAEAARPRFILMENVAEMKAGFEGAYTALLIDSLEAKHLGYSVSYKVVNAPEFGVPQRRRRAFFLASRDNEKISFPPPTHSGNTGISLFGTPDHVSVWDAMSDLPMREHGEGDDPSAYEFAPQNLFQQWARQGSSEVWNHIARRLQDVQYRRLASLAPGEGIKNLADELRPKSGYSGAYGRLTKTMVAPTITRWVFHPGSGRFGHPVQTRTITMREAARLQAFPDTFYFTGTYIQQSHQIGNAVPPLLAEHIGKSLLSLSDYSVASHSANVSRLITSEAIGAEKEMAWR